MKLLPAIGVLGICLWGAGCASIYTSIEKADDGSYTVTRIQRGFWTIHGQLYRCDESGGSLNCKKIDSQPW